MTMKESDGLSRAEQARRGSFNEIATLLRAILTGDYASKLAQEAGTGITAGVGTVYKSSVKKHGGIIHTQLIVDLTGLNSSATGDIIGVNAAANCHLGKVTAERNGTLFAGTMECLEAPATGDNDVDLYSATESTGTEDSAVGGLTETALLASGGAWTAGTRKALTALPAADEYLYLAAGGAGADATYTAGKFLIEFWGYEA